MQSTIRTELRRSKNGVGKIALALAALVLTGIKLAAEVRKESTTIYVGQHFEVRDHEQPTKFVFNGSTRVAAIIGSLSANPRLQRLRLFPGWNLCSLAVSGPFPASGAEAIKTAYQWNHGTADYSPVTLGQALAAGTVLWLNVSTNTDLSVFGDYADPVPQRVADGGAYVPGTGLEAWTLATTNGISTWDFDASSRQWSGHLSGELAEVSGQRRVLSAGQAFYVQSVAPAVLATPDPTLRVRYYHEDHLGSSSVITDSNGRLVGETAFYPFGTSRNQDTRRQVSDPYQFTQKERDGESKLDYFEARYLAGAMGRFVAVDPRFASVDLLPPESLASFLSQPQTMSGYAYARNNPVKFRDPHGYDTVSVGVEVGAGGGPAGSLGVGVVSYGKHWYSHLNPVGWGVCGTVAVGGGTPDVHAQAYFQYNAGESESFEGWSHTMDASAGEEIVGTVSYSRTSGKPTSGIAVGGGFEGAPAFGASSKLSYTKCITVGDVGKSVANLFSGSEVEAGAPNFSFEESEQTSTRSSWVEHEPPPPPPRPVPKPVGPRHIRAPSAPARYYSRPKVEAFTAIGPGEPEYANRYWGENRVP
jgi:RHS repeat-associated protein